MDHYAGIDVSLECSSVCVVDADGKIVSESKVTSEPEALIAWFGRLGLIESRPGRTPARGRGGDVPGCDAGTLA
jgi:transposase